MKHQETCTDPYLPSNTEWRAWARIDPLWSVAAWEGKRRREAGAWTDDDFYSVGAADWTDYLRHWEHYGLDPESCIEIGCGAGRLTLQLAGRFQLVHAVDVSEDMVEYARRRVDCSNVRFHVTSGTALPLPDASVTAAFSALVFRHFDRVEDGGRYFVEISRVLRPGGTMMVELPIHVWPSPNWVAITAHAVQRQLGHWRANYRRFWIARGRGQPFFRRCTYEIGWLLDTLAAAGLSRVEIRQVELSASGDRHWCLLAQRKEPGQFPPADPPRQR